MHHADTSFFLTCTCKILHAHIYNKLTELTVQYNNSHLKQCLRLDICAKGSYCDNSVTVTFVLCLADEDIPDVSDYFSELNSPHLLNLGLELGIAYTHLKDMEKMPMAEYRAELAAQWIKGADQVKKKGKATWRRLVEALRSKRLGQNGLADRIKNDKCS